MERKRRPADRRARDNSLCRRDSGADQGRRGNQAAIGEKVNMVYARGDAGAIRQLQKPLDKPYLIGYSTYKEVAT